MPLADVVSITITLQTKASTRPGFGTQLIVGELPAAVVANGGFTDRVLVLLPGDFDTVLLGLDFTTTDAMFVAVQTAFGQDPSPERVFLGRRVTPVAQVNNVSIDGTTDGTFTTTINGTDFPFVASGSSSTDIRDGLIAAIAGGSEPVTATPGGAGDFDVTADEDGVSFSMAVDHSTTPADISFTTTTPNLGIVEDLVAISAENDDWYGLTDSSHSDGVIRTASPFIETQSRIFLGQSNTADILTSAIDDVFSDLQLAALARTAPVFSNDDTAFLDAAWQGNALPTDPGSITWAFRELKIVVASVGEGVPNALNATQLGFLNGKNGNYYELIAGRSVTRHGRMADGTFIDLIRGRDFVESTIALDIFDLLANEDVVPFTDGGANQAAGVILGSLEEAAALGIVVADSIVVTVPLVSTVSVANRALRNLPDVTFAATVQGAIHTLDITGTLAV